MAEELMAELEPVEVPLAKLPAVLEGLTLMGLGWQAVWEPGCGDVLVLAKLMPNPPHRAGGMPPPTGKCMSCGRLLEDDEERRQTGRGDVCLDCLLSVKRGEFIGP
jgi:hypothetical protein